MCSYPKCARSKSSSALIRQMRGGTNNSVRITPTPERKARLHPNELMNSPKIARVTDDAADTISYQRVSRLNRDQPLNRWPSTNTDQIRNAPPAVKSTTPSQRIVSPSIVHS